MGRRHWLICCLCAVIIMACKKGRETTPDIFPGFQKPAGFPEPAYPLSRNPVTQAGFMLGRALFYEPRLSRDNTISCGSCHMQSSAFTQHGHDVSHGIDDRLGTRNSPPIMNLAWSKAFMWGGGVYDLDLQPIVPITTHEEMDEDLNRVLGKLRALPVYTGRFREAFGSADITTARMMRALSQFMLMCISSNSRYDRVMRGEPAAAFSAAEKQGYALFKEKCASCHTEPLFTDGTFRNNGLAPGPVNDLGLYTATLVNTDRYRFKVPSLRNLSYTAPYMHDGRFLSLEGVLNHYNNEVQHTSGTDPLLLQEARPGIRLSADDKIKLILFLKTLDDESFITNLLLSEQ